MVSFVANGRWGGGIDIWEHAAAARELGAHPLHPHHPLLSNVNLPHQFFNPYLLGVGLISRVTGLSVVTALNLAGLGNVVLLVVGLRQFTRRVAPRRHVDFYALLFIVFLWGPSAWFFSGFLHFNVIAVAAPYPSTFSKGLVFFALLAYINYIEGGRFRWLAVCGVMLSVVLLTHPVDASFLGIGLTALAISYPIGQRETELPGPETDSPTMFTWARLFAAQRVDRMIALVIVVFGGYLLATRWPYFSLHALLFGSAVESYRRAIASADHDMYVQAYSRAFPMLLVVPFALRRLRHLLRDPLALMFFGAMAGYAYGWRTKNWSYGRLISSAHVMGAIILADERASAGEAAAVAGEAGRPLMRWAQITTVAIVLLGMYNVRDGFEALPHGLVAHAPYKLVHSDLDLTLISDFDFLAARHKTYPVVISDVYTSMEVPTFGSKVIAYARAQAFVDVRERAADQNRFYDPQTSAATRREIVAKYGATLLIVTTERLQAEPKTYGPLVDLGTVVSRNKRFIYVDLRSPKP